VRRLRLLAAVVLALSAATVSAAPAGAHERSAYAGTVAFEHRDRGAGRAPRDALLLRTRAGTFRLRDPRLRAFVGRRVSLEAVRRGRSLVGVRGIAPRARTADHGWFADPPRRGERRVAVVLMSEAGDADRRWDPAITERAAFGAEGSVDAFFRAASGGAVSIAGRVHGWYTVEDLGEGCDMGRFVRRAVDALQADGVALDDYHHVMVHFPRRECGFNGMASLSDAPSLINGRPDDVRLHSHELGHNFGLYHADAAGCTRDGAPVTLSQTCVRHEYGDPFSTMGHGFHRFHAAERAAIGWPTMDRHVTVARDGVYELGGEGAGAAELLSVPRRLDGDWWTEPTHLAVELRRSAPPFDPFAPDDPVLNGVTVRLVHHVEVNGRSYVVAMPMSLLDATPGSSAGHRDGQLRVGETLVDERRRTAITLESLRDGVARVRVGWVPSAPAGVAARLDGGDAAEVTWAASEDDQGVAGYELERDGAVVARTTGLRLRDTGLPRGRDVGYRVVAVDGHGNRRPSARVVVTTPPAADPGAAGAGPPAPAPAAPSSGSPSSGSPPPGPPRPAGAPDRAHPVLRLSPAPGPRGRRVPRDRRLVVTARDDRAGLRVEALLGGRRIALRVLRRTRAGRLVVRLPRAASRGRHVLVLRATDAAGNRTTLRVLVARGVLRAADRGAQTSS